MPGPLERQQSGIPAVRRATAPGVVAVPDGYGPAPLQGSQPGAQGPEQGIWVRLPGSSFAPAGSTPVDETGDANVTAGGTATILTVTVPTGQRFRMAGIGFSAEDESSLSFLSWSITTNTVAVPGYINKPAAIGSVRQLADIFIVVGSDATVSVVVANSTLAAATYHFYCRLRGWYWTEKEAS